MPTYEYICRACAHEFEVFQSMNDSAKRKCPECGKNALERKIGAGAAVLFKGSGFYQTDYRTESYKKGAESDSKPADSAKTETAKTDGAKADAPKPAAKAEPKPESKKAEPKSKTKASKSRD
jgi:putative FmdB family regulatory protein